MKHIVIWMLLVSLMLAGTVELGTAAPIGDIGAKTIPAINLAPVTPTEVPDGSCVINLQHGTVMKIEYIPAAGAVKSQSPVVIYDQQKPTKMQMPGWVKKLIQIIIVVLQTIIT
jgi:hypothetical protein